MKGQAQFDQKERVVLRLDDPTPGLSGTEVMKEILGSPLPQVYPVATELFQQGTLAQEVYFIDQGAIKLVYVNPDGKEVSIGLRSSGWLLGAAAVILNEPHPVTAVTLTRCYLYRMTSETFRHLSNNNASLSAYLQQVYSREVYQQMMRIAELECCSARQRLEHFLRRLIPELEQRDPQKEIWLQVPLKHSEIARLISVSPEHFSRLLRQMEQDGIIGRKGGWLIVSSLQKLSPLPD
jgi:CRP/FNR family transcriptional regulator